MKSVRKLIFVIVIFITFSAFPVRIFISSTLHTEGPFLVLPSSGSVHELSGWLEQGEWLYVEDYCGSSSFIEYYFVSFDPLELWVMTKEAFIVFEQGGPLTNQVVHLLYSGLGAHGRFTVPLRGVWVLVFYNRNKFGAGIREGDCTINFITISDTGEPVNDDSSSDNTGGTQSSTTLDILGIFKMVIIPLLIIIVTIFTLGLFLFILHDNKHDHPKTTKRKVRQEISKILHKRGGTLMRSRH